MRLKKQTNAFPSEPLGDIYFFFLIGIVINLFWHKTKGALACVLPDKGWG